MKRHVLAVLGIVAIASFAHSQQTASTVAAAASPVPRLIRFNGVAKDGGGQPLTGVLGITFALYSQPSGGASLWMETQNVQADGGGRYSVQLGTTMPDGLPVDVFASGEARWLGVQIGGQSEQPRVLLLSVPYALKAEDAQTLGGLPASAFVLATPTAANSATTASSSGAGAPSAAPPASTPVTTSGGTVNTIPLFSTSTDIENSAITQTGSGTTAKIGIGTTTPATTLDVKGAATIRGATSVQGTLTLPSTGVATATAGKNSQANNFVASSFSSTTSTAVNQTFQWQAEPAGNNTGTPSGTLNLLFGSGATKVSETGLNIASNGQITFAAGQTFPGAGTGTVTNIATGAGLAGGPITSTGTVSIAAGGVTNAMLANPSVTITPGTALTGGGAVALGASTTLNLDTTKVPLLSTANTFDTSQNIQVASGNGLSATTSSVNNSALSGTSTATSGTSNGVSGSTMSPAGSGTVGVNFAASGNAFGVYGQTSSPTGVAVYGANLSTTGIGYGVFGASLSPNGFGVEGYSSASSGGVGVIGFGSGSTADGVQGTSFSTTGQTAGVVGTDASPTGYGVSGWNSATTGKAVGVLGRTNSPTGIAIQGSNSNTTGGGTGVYGSSSSSGGVGVEGTNTSGGLAGSFLGPVSITGNLSFPNTTSGATEGVLTIGNPILHNYGPSGSWNVFLGGLAGNFSTTGKFLTVTGSLALQNNSTGVDNTANGTEALQNNSIGSDNTSVGFVSLLNNSTGGGNTAIGSNALNNSNGAFTTALGYFAGQIKDGTMLVQANDTFLGAGAAASTGSLTNATAIGSNAVVGASNALVLGSINQVNGAEASVSVGIGTSTPAATLDVRDNSSGGDTINAVTSTVGHNAVTGVNNATTGNSNGGFFETFSSSGSAVVAQNFSNSGTNYAGWFGGNVNITGSLSKGSGSFKIDYPLDPANKYLYHSFVESPDMMNVYNGNVRTDENGRATVILPDYFEALNRDFRYQLTVIGQFAQAIVLREIEDNRFVIKTSKPGVKVSWQVTGIRQDAYANAHRIPNVVEKPENERGKYLHPELFGAGPEQGIYPAK